MMMMCAPACAFFSFLLFNAFEKSSVFSRTKKNVKTLNIKGHFFPSRPQTSFSTRRAQRERERE